jgi:hypothetical protein
LNRPNKELDVDSKIIYISPQSKRKNNIIDIYTVEAYSKIREWLVSEFLEFGKFF